MASFSLMLFIMTLLLPSLITEERASLEQEQFDYLQAWGKIKYYVRKAYLEQARIDFFEAWGKIKYYVRKASLEQEQFDFFEAAEKARNEFNKLVSQTRKQPGFFLADKPEIEAPLKTTDCDDEEKTMEDLKLLSPEELARPRGLENDMNKAMRKPCYYKQKDIR